MLDTFLRARLLVTSGATGIDYILHDRFARPIVALGALAAIVFIVSVANVAGLLLTRAAQRRTELSVRLALGAGRWTLMKEAAAECVLLVAAGAILAVVVAYWGNGVLVSTISLVYDGFALEVTPDGRILGPVVAISSLALTVFTLVPVWHLRDLEATTLAAGASRTYTQRQRAQQLIVVAQVALTIALLTVGSLMAQLLDDLRRTPLGYPIERVLSVQVGSRSATLAPPDFVDGSYHRALVDRLSAAPGVAAVALSNMAPLFMMPSLESVSALAAPDRQVTAEQHTVSEGFFAAMEIPLIKGRTFVPGDRPGGSSPVVISESLAQRLFTDGQAIGQRIRVGTRPDLSSLEVVGVARDAILLKPQARNVLVVYRSFWHSPADYRLSPNLILRAHVEPISLAPIVRAELDRDGREYPIWIRALTEQRDGALVQERLLASLSSAFAGAGLVLAGVGVYGLFSLIVAQRTREMAMRLALGATPNRVQQLVLRRAFTLVAIGMGIGLPMAWAAQSAAAGLFPADATPTVTPTAAAIGLMGAVAILASWMPARRASSVDPMVTLREQ